MKYPYVITEFDQNDVYKFYMLYAYMKLYPNIRAKWRFFNRGKHKFPLGFDKELRKQLDHMAELRFTKEMEEYFRYNFRQPNGTSLFDESYYAFLRDFRYRPENIKIDQNDNGDLEIEFDDLLIYNTLLETPVMATIVELRNRMLGFHDKVDWEKANHTDILKLDAITALNAKCSEFGFRRAESVENQERFYKLSQENHKETIIGTSNINMARRFGGKAMGTQAHEFIMIEAVLHGVTFANEMALQDWTTVYRGALGTSLPDTYGTDNFLKSFDLFYAKLFDGTRFDSGNFKIYTDKIIDKYKSHGIDPLSKYILYSDGVNSIETIRSILSYCGCISGEFSKKRINACFGIGTWFSSDVKMIDETTVEPMNIVIKLSQVKHPNMDWKYAVKISDTLGKITSIDKRTTERYLEELGLENNK